MLGASQRWCRTTTTWAQYFEKMLDMCGLIHDPDCPKAGKHCELERAEIKKSEDAVQGTMSAVRNFTNPFSIPDEDHLYSLAEALGKEAKNAFIQDRFVNSSPETQFFEPISKQKLKTMEDSSKTVKLTASQGKELI